ncbi:MAG: BppU family phage baseplate upper protein [Oscillospiraceae bacterium]|nr:BppU family phage baseplate upper protein [Oscillospiraceae bacterium]
MQVMANITLDLLRPGYAIAYGTQNDRLTRRITATLTSGGTAWTVPDDTHVVIWYSKPDGTNGFYDTDENGDSAYTISGSTINFVMAQQALAVVGNVAVQLRFYNSSEEQLSTFAFVLTVMPGINDAEVLSSDYYNVMTSTLAEMAEFADLLKAGYGAPLLASTVSAMTNPQKIYVYTGSEDGYVAGNWYYFSGPGVGNGWKSGGVYNSTAFETDKTLSQEDMAADAYMTGMALDALEDLAEIAAGNITQLQEDVSTNTSDISDLKSNLGDLEDLETENKSSIVDAINEAAQSGGSGANVPTAVRQAILTLFENAAYAITGLTDEIAVVESWAESVTSLTLSSDTLSLSGATPQAITATTVPSGKNVVWESSDIFIATVEAGVVTGVHNGFCTITARCGDLSARCAVTVSGLATLTSISAVYTQSGFVYPDDALDRLKEDLVVTAIYSDNTTNEINNYSLSGTLTAGTSSITVNYEGLTTTFNVTVSPGLQWKPSDGKFTEQAFVSEITGDLNLIETLSDDYTTFTYTGVQNYPSKIIQLLPTTFTDYAQIMITFRVITTGWGTSGLGAMQLRASNGNDGINFGFPRTSSGATVLTPKYKTGTSDVAMSKTLSLNSWHTIVATYENGKITFTIDNEIVASDINPATQYTTYNAVVFSGYNTNMHIDMSEYCLRYR